MKPQGGPWGTPKAPKGIPEGPTGSPCCPSGLPRGPRGRALGLQGSHLGPLGLPWGGNLFFEDQTNFNFNLLEALHPFQSGFKLWGIAHLYRLALASFITT